MKNTLYINFIFIFFAISIFSSQQNSSKQEDGAMKVKKFFENLSTAMLEIENHKNEITRTRHEQKAGQVKKNQEKVDQFIIEESIKADMKNKMKELITNNIGLRNRLINQGLSEKEALDKVYQADDHVKLMHIQTTYPRYVEILKEIYIEQRL